MGQPAPQETCRHHKLDLRAVKFTSIFFFHGFLSYADFFMTLSSAVFFFRQNQLFRKKNISGIATEWIQIRQSILSGLIWVQTICKDYQQKTLADEELVVIKILKINSYTLILLTN